MLEGGAGCDSQNCETCADGFHLGSVRYLLFTVGKCQHVFCRMSNIVKALNARCKYCISTFSGFSRFSQRSRSELDLFSHSLPKNRWNCWWVFFTDWMPFLSLDRRCESTEGNCIYCVDTERLAIVLCMCTFHSTPCFIKKTTRYWIAHNSGKYWPIFKILSLSDSAVNVEWRIIKYPTTLEMRHYVHYLVTVCHLQIWCLSIAGLSHGSHFFRSIFWIFTEFAADCRAWYSLLLNLEYEPREIVEPKRNTFWDCNMPVLIVTRRPVNFCNRRKCIGTHHCGRKSNCSAEWGTSPAT